MVRICSRVGVPNTLIISTNWSMPDSPGNSGWPSISSAITQPVDQTSITSRNQPKSSPTLIRLKLTDFCRVISSPKNQLWRTVVSRANVGYIRLVLNQDLCTAKIAELQHTSVWIEEEILRFNVSMADSLGMNVRKRTEKLIDVDLDLKNRHGRLHLIEKAGSTVYGFRDKF